MPDLWASDATRSVAVKGAGVAPIGCRTASVVGTGPYFFFLGLFQQHAAAATADDDVWRRRVESVCGTTAGVWLSIPAPPGPASRHCGRGPGCSDAELADDMLLR